MIFQSLSSRLSSAMPIAVSFANYACLNAMSNHVKGISRLRSSIKRIIQIRTGYSIWKATELEIGASLYNDITRFLGRNISVVLDVGANIGQSATQYNRWFSHAKIYSFEPFSDSYETLKSHTLEIKNIIPQQFALSDTNEDLRVVKSQVSCDSTNSLRGPASESDGESESICCMRLDTWLDNKQIQHVDFLKVDVEGYELQVIKGGDQSFREGRVALALFEAGLGSTNMWTTPLNKIIDHMNVYGYELIGLYDTSLIQLKNKSHYTNALFASPRLIDSLPPLAAEITCKGWPFQSK